MQHLFNSCVAVYRLIGAAADGRPSFTYQPQSAPLNRVRCRLDMTFIRPGKDQPPAYEAGKAPDRVGLLLCDPDVPLRAGDVVTSVPNDFGDIPVTGTFEIRVIPDVPQAYAARHHIEVQIIETAQVLGVPNFPGSE